MTPLPAALLAAPAPLTAWRLDQKKHAPTWNSGEGARLGGGRWNSKGRKVVYCALDPATAILEVAVHKGFKALDVVQHTLTSLAINDPALVHVVQPSAVPNANWLRPGYVSDGQQQFGDKLLAIYPFIVVPSVVSHYSWNVVFDVDKAIDHYALLEQVAFELDGRLHPPPLKKNCGANLLQVPNV